MIRVFIFAILIITACRHHSKDEIIDTTTESSLEDVLEYLNELIEDNNANYQTYFKRSEVYFHLNDYKNALNDIQKSLELNSTFQEAYLLQSQIYFKEEKFDQCINSALQAELRGLRNYELYQLLAIGYLKEGQIENAQKSIQRLLDFNRSAENLSLKGDIYLQLKDTVTSVKSYESAISENNFLIRPYKALFNIYKSNNLKNAEYYVDRYLRKDSSNSEFLMLKADILAGRKSYDSAINLYIKADYEQFDDKEIFNKLANYYLRMDSVKMAENLAQASILLDSTGNREALLVMARCLDAKKDYAESKKYYSSMLQIDSTDVIASEELDKLNRKIAYLWRLEQQKKAFDSIRKSAPPVVERKEVNQ